MKSKFFSVLIIYLSVVTLQFKTSYLWRPNPTCSPIIQSFSPDYAKLSNYYYPTNYELILSTYLRLGLTGYLTVSFPPG